MAMDNPANRILRAGPGRRDIELFSEPLAPAPWPPAALVRNELTLIYSGRDLETVARAEDKGQWLDLGAIAIGVVERAGEGGPAAGERIYWNGPHANYAWLEPSNALWVPVDAADPLILPAAIGAEAESGLTEALSEIQSNAQGDRIVTMEEDYGFEIPEEEAEKLQNDFDVGIYIAERKRRKEGRLIPEPADPPDESPDESEGSIGLLFPFSAIVVGQGMLGHLAAQWLQRRGGSVTVVENSPKRLEFSKYSGLATRIDTHNADWEARLAKLHPGGADLLVDAIGNPHPFPALIRHLRPGGLLCRLGAWRTAEYAPEVSATLATRANQIYGPRPHFGRQPGDGKLLADWIGLIRSRRIKTERILTHTVDPAEGAMAFKRLATGIRSWNGVVIDWTK